MKIINMHEAKTTLSRLVQQAMDGKDVIIARSGHAVVRLVPVALNSRRVPGLAKGKIRRSEDFNAPPTEKAFGEFLGS